MSDDTKTCPSCSEQIRVQAKVCRHCGFDFERPHCSGVPNKGELRPAKSASGGTLSRGRLTTEVSHKPWSWSTVFGYISAGLLGLLAIATIKETLVGGILLLSASALVCPPIWVRLRAKLKRKGTLVPVASLLLAGLGLSILGQAVASPDGQRRAKQRAVARAAQANHDLAETAAKVKQDAKDESAAKAKQEAEDDAAAKEKAKHPAINAPSLEPPPELSSGRSFFDPLRGVTNKVADDAVAQYNIAARQGDPMQTCVQAGLVSAAYLQAQNEISYRRWKDTEQADCRRAGIPR